MTCWVCQGTSAFTDDYGVDWCQEHLAIHAQAWLEAIERSASDFIL